MHAFPWEGAAYGWGWWWWRADVLNLIYVRMLMTGVLLHHHPRLWEWEKKEQKIFHHATTSAWRWDISGGAKKMSRLAGEAASAASAKKNGRQKSRTKVFEWWHANFHTAVIKPLYGKEQQQQQRDTKYVLKRVHRFSWRLGGSWLFVRDVFLGKRLGKMAVLILGV